MFYEVELNWLWLLHRQNFVFKKTKEMIKWDLSSLELICQAYSVISGWANEGFNESIKKCVDEN